MRPTSAGIEVPVAARAARGARRPAVPDPRRQRRESRRARRARERRSARHPPRAPDLRQHRHRRRRDRRRRDLPRLRRLRRRDRPHPRAAVRRRALPLRRARLPRDARRPGGDRAAASASRARAARARRRRRSSPSARAAATPRDPRARRGRRVPRHLHRRSGLGRQPAPGRARPARSGTLAPWLLAGAQVRCIAAHDGRSDPSSRSSDRNLATKQLSEGALRSSYTTWLNDPTCAPVRAAGTLSTSPGRASAD